MRTSDQEIMAASVKQGWQPGLDRCGEITAASVEHRHPGSTGRKSIIARTKHPVVDREFVPVDVVIPRDDCNGDGRRAKDVFNLAELSLDGVLCQVTQEQEPEHRPADRVTGIDFFVERCHDPLKLKLPRLHIARRQDRIVAGAGPLTTEPRNLPSRKGDCDGPAHPRSGAGRQLLL